MTTPYDASGAPEQDPSRSAPEDTPPVSLDKPAEPAADAPFDPYRFGAPDRPVPPEYAPPGYRPPPTFAQPPPEYPPAYPQQPGYPQQSGYPQQPGYPPPYGYSAQYPYAAPPYHAYPPPPSGNGRAVAALVLGILSIVFFWTSLFDLVLIIPALILGFLGIGDARRRHGGRGIGMARAGLICTAAGTIFALLFTVFVVHRVNHCTDLYGSTGSSFDHCIRHGN